MKIPKIRSEVFPRAPSDAFMIHVVYAATSCVIACEHCGRIHYTQCEPNVWADEDQESHLAELISNHKIHPDIFIEHDDTVAYGTIDGKTFVRYCPCNAGGRYEELFWNHRHLIIPYLRGRAEDIKQAADVFSEAVNDPVLDEA